MADPGTWAVISAVATTVAAGAATRNALRAPKLAKRAQARDAAVLKQAKEDMSSEFLLNRDFSYERGLNNFMSQIGAMNPLYRQRYPFRIRKTYEEAVNAKE